MKKFSFRNKKAILPVILILIVVWAAFLYSAWKNRPQYSESVRQIPPFEGKPYVVIHDNQPEFTQDQLVTTSYEEYAPLDHLGRCGAAIACIGRDLMPTQERGSIGQVKPTGWQTVKYDFVDGKYLYNRCHLIGYQLSGENANERNLITGTRYMNVEGMLPFENLIADYVKETGNHVLYRVTPVFDGENLLARGVQLEAWSVEDSGEGVCFHVYVYNNQPGVEINYTDGTSTLAAAEGEQETFVMNTGSKKFHTADCPQGDTISEAKRQEVTTTRQMLINQGFAPAGCCKP